MKEEKMDEDGKNKIDNEWKGQIDKEKKEAGEKNEKYHQPTFKIFLSSISMQAMIAMGRIKDPVRGELEKNLEQARFLIDTLGILEEKTKGNLVSE